MPLQYAADVLHRLLGLRLDSAGDERERAIGPDLPREIQHVTDAHGVRERQRAWPVSRQVLNPRRVRLRPASTSRGRPPLVPRLCLGAPGEKQTKAEERDESRSCSHKSLSSPEYSLMGKRSAQRPN